MKYHFIRQSDNSKTGPMPTTMTEKSSCPASCPLKAAGCYALAGRVNIHWDRLTDRGLTLAQLTARIRDIPAGKLWRHNVGGDLARAGDLIDARALQAITRANAGRRGFAYTHALPRVGENARHIARANADGFTINLSADNLTEADALADLHIAPVVTILPSDQKRNTTTPAGRPVIICPNHTDPRIQCIDCRACASRTRSAIIGFPAHGYARHAVNAVFNTPQI